MPSNVARHLSGHVQPSPSATSTSSRPAPPVRPRHRRSHRPPQAQVAALHARPAREVPGGARGARQHRRRPLRRARRRVRENGSTHVVAKELRAISDFEYEFAMAQLDQEAGARHRDSLHDGLARAPASSARAASRRGSDRVQGLGRRPGAPGRRPPAWRRSIRHAAAHRLPKEAAEYLDVLVLIDQLDGIIHNARSVPLTDSVMIDRRSTTCSTRCATTNCRSTGRLDRTRSARRCSQGQSGADRMLADAQERAGELASRRPRSCGSARETSRRIMEARRAPSARSALGAEDYADEVLGDLDESYREVHRRGAPQPREAPGPRRRRRAPRQAGRHGRRLPIEVRPAARCSSTMPAEHGARCPSRSGIVCGGLEYHVPDDIMKPSFRPRAWATTSRSRSTYSTTCSGRPALPGRRRHRRGRAACVRAARRVGRRGRGRRVHRLAPGAPAALGARPHRRRPATQAPVPRRFPGPVRRLRRRPQRRPSTSPTAA